MNPDPAIDQAAVNWRPGVDRSAAICAGARPQDWIPLALPDICKYAGSQEWSHANPGLACWRGRCSPRRDTGLLSHGMNLQDQRKSRARNRWALLRGNEGGTRLVRRVGPPSGPFRIAPSLMADITNRDRV